MRTRTSYFLPDSVAMKMKLGVERSSYRQHWTADRLTIDEKKYKFLVKDKRNEVTQTNLK